ncbi:hypothetical protein [Streptosporangium sp. KLBMP 9127]|nr:hypothetical protein [Streptosporangium sp. KLBMP 9127]
MAFIGVLLMIQGFGSLIAKHLFDRDFGLLQRVFDGGAHTLAGAAEGLLGLALVVLSVRREAKKGS